MKFSARYDLDPSRPKQPLVDDAPEWLRNAYIQGILDEITYVDEDSRYSNSEKRPIGIKRLCRDFCTSMRVLSDNQDWDSWTCWDALKFRILNCEWFYFFDLVELVGSKLKRIEEENLFDTDYEWSQKYGFETYRIAVNKLFEEENVAWRLTNEGTFSRSVPKELERRSEEPREKLKDDLEPAREHYRKAHRFLFEHPIDPENSIKEIISAVESVSRVMFPSTSTLGEAVKEMRKTTSVPTLLLSVVEKFYAFGNAEAAVRHGSNLPSRIELLDAEFCFHTGVALIRYLVELRESFRI